MALQMQSEQKQDTCDSKQPSFKDVSAKWKPLLNFPKRQLKQEYPGSWVEKPCGINRQQKISQFVQHLKCYKCDYYISKQTGSVTFFPSPFLSANDLAKQTLPHTSFVNSTQLTQIISQHNCNKLEYTFDAKANIIPKPNDIHPFILALELAYFKHYPLRISPSHIWLLILHAVSTHVDINAETLRKKYVLHEGKKELSVTMNEFVKGSPNNDWSSAIKAIVEKIDENTVKDTVPLLEVDFSDTTCVEMIAGKVGIMDMVKRYFSFRLLGGCGFPQITLNGSKKDWMYLKQKSVKLLNAKVVPEFGKKWSVALISVLDRFINAFDGKIDCVFWNAMIRRGGVLPSMLNYGMDSMEERNGVSYSGWFNVFFPYLSDVTVKPMGKNMMSFMPHLDQDMREKQVMNLYCAPYSEKEDYVTSGLIGNGGGMKMSEIPSGLAAAPFTYVDLNDNGKEYDMKLISGFIGCEQSNVTLEISPKIGWIVAQK